MTRNQGATIYLPTEDEWYKAAYHNAVGISATDYFDYPTGTDVATTWSAPTATANRGSCGLSDLTPVGSYTGSASPYGTFDQGGNVTSWTEAILRGRRVNRVGAYTHNTSSAFMAAHRGVVHPASHLSDVGIRLMSPVPEPGTGLLLMMGLLGFACRREARA